MIKEEAINHLKTVAKSAIDSGYDSAVVDAVSMAIKALEQESCVVHIKDLSDDEIKKFEEVMKNVTVQVIPKEPCEDWYDIPSDEMTLEQARQAVRDLRKMWAEHLEQDTSPDCISRQEVIEVIKNYASMLWKKYHEPFPESTIMEIIQALPPVTVQYYEDAISRQKVLEYIEGSEAELGHDSETQLLTFAKAEFEEEVTKEEYERECFNQIESRTESEVKE